MNPLGMVLTAHIEIPLLTISQNKLHDGELMLKSETSYGKTISEQGRKKRLHLDICYVSAIRIFGDGCLNRPSR